MERNLEAPIRARIIMGLRRTSFTLMLVTTLVAAAALAQAQGPGAGAPGGRRADLPGGATPCATNATGANVTMWRESCRTNMTSLARLSLQHFHENRTLVHAKVKAADAQAKADFYHGMATSVEQCRADTAGVGRNASGPHSGVFAQCMKEKMVTLKNTTRASAQSERQTLGQQLRDAKTVAQAEWTTGRDAWLAANPPPS